MATQEELCLTESIAPLMTFTGESEDSAISNSTRNLDPGVLGGARIEDQNIEIKTAEKSELKVEKQLKSTAKFDKNYN